MNLSIQQIAISYLFQVARVLPRNNRKGVIVALLVRRDICESRLWRDAGNLEERKVTYENSTTDYSPRR